MSNPLSDREREQLSALLDGRLTEKEKAGLAREIADSPELAEEWNQLKRLKAALAALPRHKVRRSFALKPDSVSVRKPSGFLFPLRLVSGLAAAGLTILLALDSLPLLKGTSLMAAAPAAPAAASESIQADRIAGNQSTGEIVTWSTPTPEAVGKGGGPAQFGKGGGPSETVANPGIMALPAQPSGSAVNAAPPSPAVEAPNAAQPTSPPAAENTLQIPPGESPILGIPPTEEQGKVMESSVEATARIASPQISIHPLAEIILLIIALGAALAAVIVNRRK
jgi:hypothetical protein